MKKSFKLVFLFVLVLAVSVTTTAFAADNVAPKATVTASSSFNSDYSADKTVDTLPIQHGVGEWASSGEVNPWIQLDWAEPVTINKIVVYDRVNLQDNATSAVITFNDGSTVELTDIDPTGLASAVEFDAKTVTSAKIQITGTGVNVGFAEIEAFAAPAAAATENPKTGDAGVSTYLIALAASGIALFVILNKRKFAFKN